MSKKRKGLDKLRPELIAFKNMTKDKPVKNLFIISGTTKGLGKAIYEYASQLPHNEFLAINRHLLKSSHPHTTAFQLDLTNPLDSVALHKLFSGSAQWRVYETIYLVNNAATIQPIKPVGQIELSEILKSWRINFLNHAGIINEFIKMTGRLRGTKRRILNISSGAAESPHYGIALYCSAKAALEMLTMSIFKEQEVLKQVKIMAFRPGVMDTAMQQQIRRSSKDDFWSVERFKRLFQEHQLSDPHEIARLVYKILTHDKYWAKPVLDISEVKYE